MDDQNSSNQQSSSKNPSVPFQQLKYPIDAASKKIIQDIILGFAPIASLDYQWDNYFLYSSLFEDITRYTISSSGTDVGVGPKGLILTTAAADPSFAFALLNVTGSDIVQFNKITRFRTTAQLDNVTETLLSIAAVSDGSGFIGFNIDKGSILGITTIDGVTLNTVELGNLAINTIVQLEFRYIPNKQVVFYVNGVVMGTITKGFPNGSGGLQEIFNAQLANYDANAHNAYVGYYEYIQQL